MTTIGHLRQNPDGTMRGSLQSSQRSVSLVLEPIPQDQRGDTDKAPDYRVSGITRDGEYYELGAAWKKRLIEGQTKRDYLSLSLDDPDWKSPLSCAAFPTKGKPGEFDLIWNRPQSRQAA